MKHPQYEILQDYFENVLNPYHEKLVKDHLLDCDQCTRVLADFAVIETKLKKQPVLQISERTKNKIFADARKMFSARQDKEDQLIVSAKERAAKREKIQKNFQEWRESIFPELKAPALQLCSLSIVLMVIIAVEKGHGGQEEMYEPLNSDVNVFTHKDLAYKAEE